MSAISRSQILCLYRRLLREGMKFNHYNYREFSVRRVRDYFRAKRSLTDTNEIKKEYKYGIDSLSLIHRQTTIGQLYTHDKNVVETIQKIH